MATVFYINFRPHHHRVTYVGFYIDHSTPWNDLADDLMTCMYELEKTYGIFDWTISETHGNIFGCVSHLAPSKHEDVMRAIRQTLHNCTLGPVCTINAYTVETQEILRTTAQAYEEQKIKQLRARLHAHIGTVASIGHPKKM